jgi:DHA2 family multidrug resistance protein
MTQPVLAGALWHTWHSQRRLMLAVLPGLALTMLHSAMLDLPRADLVAALDSDRYRIQWIIGAYILGSATGMALTRFLGSRLGLRNAYLLALALFTVGSTACAGVTEVIEMTPFRVVQGFGTGLLISTGMVMLWRAFPKRRELAMVLYGLSVYLPALAGVPLGGWLQTWLSWRAIFLVNLPLGIGIGLGAWYLLPSESPVQRVPVALDWLGLGLLLLGIITLSVVMDLGQYWGWLSSPFFVPWLAVLLLSLAAFIAWGVWSRAPLINLRVLGTPHFALGLGIKVLFSINLYVLSSLLSGYMIQMRGYQWYQGSLVVLPALATMLLGVLAGVLVGTDHNRRLRMATGLTLMTVATAFLSLVDVYTARGWQAAHFALWGFGAGLVIGPALLTTFEGLTDEETLRTAGVFNILRTLPVFFVGSLLATLLTQQTDAHFDTLRQTIQYNRPMVMETDRGAERYFTQRGSSLLRARPQTHALLGQWVKLNARAFALQYVLRWLAVVPAAGLILVWFVRVDHSIADQESGPMLAPEPLHT